MRKSFHFFTFSSKKAVLLAVLTMVLAMATIGATLAYIIVQTQSIENQFPPPNLDIQVIDGNKVTNTGDVPVYVRAAVVANWVDADGAILSEQPVAGTDYTLTVADGWFLGSDTFYYRAVTLAAADNASLITEALQLVTKEGYTLQVQVLA